jgi:hypothetical protein
MVIAPVEQPARSRLGEWARRLGGVDPDTIAAASVPALFLYAWLVIKPCLIFHGAGTISNFPVFKTGIGSFLDTMSRPGGAVEYASAFLGQLFVWSWAGAAAIVGLGWLLFRVTDAAAQFVRDPSLRILRFAGPVALAVTFAQYRFEVQTYLAFAASIGLAVVVCRMPLRWTIPSLFAGSLAVYYLAGGGYVVFAACCAMYEGRVRQRRWGTVAALSTVALIPFAMGMLGFGYDPWEAYTPLLPFSLHHLVHLLLPTATAPGGLPGSVSLVEVGAAAGFCLVCVLPMLGKGIRSLVRPGPVASRRWAVNRQGLSRRRPVRILAFAAAVVGLVLVTNHERRDELEADLLACQGKWPELVERAQRYSPSRLVLHSVNRALLHTGELSDRMFAFRQTGGDVLLLGRDPRVPYQWGRPLPTAPCLWRRATVFMDLGLLHVALAELVQLTEHIGYRPMVLKQISLAALAVGDIGTARVSLGMLAKSLFDSDWATEKLALLGRDDLLAADPEIQRLRRRMCATTGTASRRAIRDIMETFVDDEGVLERLVAGAPGNDMAFEYLAAMRLLDRQLDAFAEGLAQRGGPAAQRLGLHYQEALLLYRESSRGDAPAARLVVDPGVIDRRTAYRSRSQNRTAGDKATYWCYYDAAGRSGVAR